MSLSKTDENMVHAVSLAALIGTVTLIMATLEGDAPWWAPLLPLPAAFAFTWLWVWVPALLREGVSLFKRRRQVRELAQVYRCPHGHGWMQFCEGCDAVIGTREDPAFERRK